MGLGVDEDRGAGRVAIGDPLCRVAVEEALGSRKAVRFTLPEGKDRAGASPITPRRDSVFLRSRSKPLLVMRARPSCADVKVRPPVDPGETLNRKCSD
jgi:hypothetical protein